MENLGPKRIGVPKRTMQLLDLNLLLAFEECSLRYRPAFGKIHVQLNATSSSSFGAEPAAQVAVAQG